MSLHLRPHLLLWTALSLLFITLYAAAYPTTQAQTSAIVINEALPRPLGPAPEWVELYNAGSSPVDVTGWRIDDGNANSPPTFIDDSSVIMSGDPANVQPGAFLVIQLDPPMLDISYDSIQLIASDNTVIDSVAYADAKPNQSYLRMPDASANWEWQWMTTPGMPNDGSPLTPTPDATNTPTATRTATATATAEEPPATATATRTATATAEEPPATATATRTATATATGTATATVSRRAASGSLVINEILPMQSTNNAGWIELYNPADTPVHITGEWFVLLETGLGSPRQHALQDQVVSASGFVVYQFASGFLSLNGATMQLYDDHGSPVGETIHYPALSADQVYARVADGAAEWRSDYPPSPGSPNLAATPTSTATSTPSQTPTPEPQLLFINELLPAPDTATVEWLEIYNPAGQPINLEGWTIRRTSGSDVIRTYTLTATTIQAAGFVAQELPSGFLPNSGATLELFDAQGRLIGQAVEYPELGTNQVYARVADGAAEWRSDYPPSPGGPNLAPTPTSTVVPTETSTSTSTPTATLVPSATPEPRMLVVNEILPAPAAESTEWIELYNPETSAINTGGWSLRRNSSGVIRTHTLVTMTVSAAGFVVQELPSGFLPNSGATLELFDAQGRLIGQAVSYPELDKDQGYARTSDGAATWSKDYPLSRGASNQPPDATATPTRTPASSNAGSSTSPSPKPTSTPTRTAAPSTTPSDVPTATPTAAPSQSTRAATSTATAPPVATQAASQVQSSVNEQPAATPLAETATAAPAVTQEAARMAAENSASSTVPTSTSAPIVVQAPAAPSAAPTLAAVPAAVLHSPSDTAALSPLGSTSTYTGSTGWRYAADEKGNPYRYQPAGVLAVLAPGTAHAAQLDSDPPDLAPASASSDRRQIGLLAGLLLIGLAGGGLWFRYRRP